MPLIYLYLLMLGLKEDQEMMAVCLGLLPKYHLSLGGRLGYQASNARQVSANKNVTAKSSNLTINKVLYRILKGTGMIHNIIMKTNLICKFQQFY